MPTLSLTSRASLCPNQYQMPLKRKEDGVLWGVMFFISRCLFRANKKRIKDSQMREHTPATCRLHHHEPNDLVPGFIGRLSTKGYICCFLETCTVFQVVADQTGLLYWRPYSWDNISPQCNDICCSYRPEHLTWANVARIPNMYCEYSSLSLPGPISHQQVHKFPVKVVRYPTCRSVISHVPFQRRDRNTPTVTPRVFTP